MPSEEFRASGIIFLMTAFLKKQKIRNIPVEFVQIRIASVVINLHVPSCTYIFFPGWTRNLYLMFFLKKKDFITIFYELNKRGV